MARKKDLRRQKKALKWVVSYSAVRMLSAVSSAVKRA